MCKYLRMKVCSRCKQGKNITLFCKNRKSKDGYGTLCLECRKLLNIANKEKHKIWWRQYYAKNRKTICAKKIIYNLNHNDKNCAVRHLSYVKNKSKRLLKYKQKQEDKRKQLHIKNQIQKRHSLSLSEYLSS